MRLAFIAHTNALWTPDWARFFRERGDDVVVVSFSPEKIEGIDVRFVGNEPFEKYGNKHLFLTRIPRVRRILQEFRPDLVFAPYLASNGLTAALAWRGPLVVSAVGSDVLGQPGQSRNRRLLNDLVVRLICHRADRVHTVSENLDAAFTRLGVPGSKLFRMPIGIDLDRFAPSIERPPSRRVEILCTRKHEPVYDIPTILDALVRLRQDGAAFRCRFAGGGHLLDTHREHARAIGLANDVEFLGNVPADRMGGLLRDADVYVSASLSDGTSSALLEAMAVGLLPVVTRIDANTPWIEDGITGLLFAANDAPALATALRRAVDDEELRKRARVTNRRRVELEGDHRRNSTALREVFARVIASRD